MPEILEFFPSGASMKSLIELQYSVSEKVILRDDFDGPVFIAGIDQAFIDNKIISGIVILDYLSLEIIECVFAIEAVVFHYIPTFLSFREGPAMVSAFSKLKKRPDILMVDGAGINHPRGAGIASHIGVALNIPTIGITKNILVGAGEQPGNKDEATPLIYDGLQVGWQLKSQKNTKPIIVAPGHRISMESSLLIVRACIRSHKLPEPARCAHNYVNEIASHQSSHASD